MKKRNIGSTFDSWLRKEGLHEKVSATAIKRAGGVRDGRTTMPGISSAAIVQSTD